MKKKILVGMLAIGDLAIGSMACTSSGSPMGHGSASSREAQDGVQLHPENLEYRGEHMVVQVPESYSAAPVQADSIRVAEARAEGLAWVFIGTNGAISVGAYDVPVRAALEYEEQTLFENAIRDGAEVTRLDGHFRLDFPNGDVVRAGVKISRRESVCFVVKVVLSFNGSTAAEIDRVLAGIVGLDG